MKELSIADLYAINTIATNSLNGHHYSLEYFNYWKAIQTKSNEDLADKIKQYNESISK